jgi:uncharacterized protein involved in response to NO
MSITARFALFNLGFRPFYLLGSVFAAFSVGLWVLQYTGVAKGALLRGSALHGHEMLFGFTMAVVAGFLFTAVRNWTGRPTPEGATLAAIVALWVTGRVFALTPWTTAAALASALFPLVVAVAVAMPLVASGNRRNYFFVALLAGVALAASLVHLSLLGAIQRPPRAGLQAGLDVVLFIVAVIGGRVIPMFTNNGVPGAGARRNAWVERTALAALLALLAADVLALRGPALAALAFAAALAHLVRLALWNPWRTLRNPLVWILHAAYAWIVVHLALRGLAEFGLVFEQLALHALAIGAIGGMTLGMMTRTARGHTGRPLEAGRAELACFVLVQLAALTRVFAPLVAPAAYTASVAVSGALWSAAFAIYAVRYWPVLTLPRVDGKPG